MKIRTRNFHKFARFMIKTLFLVIITSLPSALDAQLPRAVGSLTGDVSDKKTGAYLDGAVVEIKSLGKKTYTDSMGAYSFTGLPEGDYELLVSYTGLDSERRSIKIVAGQWTRANFDLTAAILELETYTVISDREGNAASLAQQQKADNIINVMATDAFGDIADGNIGNFLQLLPGVTGISADSEIEQISLRGAPPSMSGVSLNGTGMPTAKDDRSVIVAAIPAELIKQVEVTKAITPDMDATSIGGAVNLVTRSASDFKRRYIIYRAALTNNTYRDGNPWTPYYTLTAMDAFFDRKLGVSLTGSYNKTLNPRDRVQMSHRYPDARNTQARFLSDKIERLRTGLSMKLEYKFDRDAFVFFDAVYSGREHSSARSSSLITTSYGSVADYAIRSEDDIKVRGLKPLTSDGRTTAGVAPGFTDTYTELLNPSFAIGSTYNYNTLDNYIYTIGGKKTWGRLAVAAQVRYSEVKTDVLNHIVSFSKTGNFGYAIDTSAGPENPAFTQTYGSNIYEGSDMTTYRAKYTQEPMYTSAKIIDGQIDAKYVTTAWNFPVELKSGVKFRRQTREGDTNNSYAWNYLGPDGVQGNNASTGKNDDNLGQFLTGDGYGLFRWKYPIFDEISVKAMQRMFNEHRDYFRLSVLPKIPPSEITENSYAGYIMGRASLKPGLFILGGVRFETTEFEGTGSFKKNTETEYSTTTSSGSYRKLFPGLHLRYDPFPNLALRAAYTTGMTRPNIGRITPSTSISISGGEDGEDPDVLVKQNNPDIKPQYSKNLDIMLDYYFKPAGVLSFGYFRKDIQDFITTLRSTIAEGPDNGFNGEYAGGTLSTYVNLGNAKIEGYELNYQHRLIHLPKPFNMTSVYMNYTNLKTEGTYNDGVSELTNFIPRLFNAGISWRYQRFSLRLDYTYRSGYLSILFPTDHTRDIRWNGNGTWNLSASYTFRPNWLTFYCNIVNIGNNWPSAYAINPNWLDIVEVYGTRITFGINGRF